jgi:hypothetical protein
MWNVAESGDTDSDMPIYSAVEMTGSELGIVECGVLNIAESGDADYACPFVLLWK